MSLKIAINGFGRIGRCAYKIAMERGDCEIVAINDLTNPRVLAHLLQHDTAYGLYDKEVTLEEDGKVIKLTDSTGEKHFFDTKAEKNYLVVTGQKTLVLSEKDATKLPWKDLGVDVVLECTGRFTKDDSANVHIQSGAKKVVISAPTKGGQTQTFLLGVNGEQYLGQNVISNASCTTNCVAPVLAVMDKNFKIKKAIMTTVHAVTNNQNVVDSAPFGEKVDMRRARAAGFNMIPTSTGASDAVAAVLPQLDKLFDGSSIRVPVITGSLSDITMLVEKKTTVEEVNNVFLEAIKNPIYKNVLHATYEPLVSSDIIKTKYSSIVDLGMTRIVDGDLVKIMAWYDNEWGYSNRLVEMAVMMNG
jgi:glyceraldehyde 3-phosphate dehydrogenase